MSSDEGRFTVKAGATARAHSASVPGLVKTVVLSSTLACVVTIVIISFLLRNTAFVNIYIPQQSTLDTSDARDDPVRRSSATNAHLTILHQAVAKGAVCLDGSPPGYYFRQGYGGGANNWIIHFFGGAWCFDEEACLQRSKTLLGSSSYFPPHPPALQGILSDDAKVNADFYNWNLVLLCYCDGASFTGYRREPVNVQGEYIYMRGKKILEVILDDLLAGEMQRADRILLTGTSAGSLAVIIHADYVRSRIPKSIDVRALADSGYFVDIATTRGDNIINRHFKKMFYVHNSLMGVDEDCARSLSPPIRWKCIFPQHTVRYLSTPLFVLQSAYDWWHLIHIRGINCQPPEYQDSYAKKMRRTARDTTGQTMSRDTTGQTMSRDTTAQTMSRDTTAQTMSRDTTRQTMSRDRAWGYKHIHGIFCKPPECTHDEMRVVLQYRNVTLFALRPVFSSKSSGLFLSSCFEHSQSLYDDVWNGVLINGVSVARAVGDWCFARTTQHRHIDCIFPCNPSCTNVW